MSPTRGHFLYDHRYKHNTIVTARRIQDMSGFFVRVITWSINEVSVYAKPVNVRYNMRLFYKTTIDFVFERVVYKLMCSANLYAC